MTFDYGKMSASENNMSSSPSLEDIAQEIVNEHSLLLMEEEEADVQERRLDRLLEGGSEVVAVIELAIERLARSGGTDKQYRNSALLCRVLGRMKNSQPAIASLRRLASAHSNIFEYRHVASAASQALREVGDLSTSHVYQAAASTAEAVMHNSVSGEDKPHGESQKSNKANEASASKSRPPIDRSHLDSHFVELEGNAGAGSSFFDEGLRNWNRHAFDVAFDLMQKAISAGLSSPYESQARCILGNIMIRRGDLLGAVTQYLACLAEPRRTDQTTWEAANRLAIIYQEASCLDDAGKLKALADSANTRDLALEGSQERYIRSLVRITIKNLSDASPPSEAHARFRGDKPQEELQKSSSCALSDQDMVAELTKLCTAYAKSDPIYRELEPIATSIGEQLAKRGGLSEMRRIFGMIPDMKGKRTLEMHWIRDALEWRRRMAGLGKRGQCGLARPRVLPGVSPAWVIVSHLEKGKGVSAARQCRVI